MYDVHTYVRDFECHSITQPQSERGLTAVWRVVRAVEIRTFSGPQTMAPQIFHAHCSSRVTSCLTCYSAVGSLEAGAQPRPVLALPCSAYSRTATAPHRQGDAQHSTSLDLQECAGKWWTYNGRILRTSNVPRAAVPETPKRAVSPTFQR